MKSTFLNRHNVFLCGFLAPAWRKAGSLIKNSSKYITDRKSKSLPAVIRSFRKLARISN